MLRVQALRTWSGTFVIRNNFINPPEPSYQGRLLSQWLADLGSGEPTEKQAQAGEAIRHMGRKTLPFLLLDLAMPQPNPGLKTVHYLKPDTRTQDQRSRQATRAFEALGPLGKPAIPELKMLLEQNPGYVPLALGGIGRDAVPELLHALTNGTFWVRDNTACALANALYSEKITAPDASSALPVALDNLTYTDTNTLFLHYGRQQIRQTPNYVVPQLRP
jgi:hypothetical protein